MPTLSPDHEAFTVNKFPLSHKAPHMPHPEFMIVGAPTLMGVDGGASGTILTTEINDFTACVVDFGTSIYNHKVYIPASEELEHGQEVFYNLAGIVGADALLTTEATDNVHFGFAYERDSNQVFPLQGEATVEVGVMQK